MPLLFSPGVLGISGTTADTSAPNNPPQSDLGCESTRQEADIMFILWIFALGGTARPPESPRVRGGGGGSGGVPSFLPPSLPSPS